MELDEFHVLQVGPGSKGDRMTIGGGNLGIGRFTKQSPRPASGQYCLLGPHARRRTTRIVHDRTATDPLDVEQVDREGVLPHLHSFPLDR